MKQYTRNQFHQRSIPTALTKAQIVGSVSERLGFTRRRSIETVETHLEIMKKTVESGEDVMISRFGKFFAVKINYFSKLLCIFKAL